MHGVPLQALDPGTTLLAGKRAAILIYYEQLLVRLIVTSATEHPDILMGIANEYWAERTRIPAGQNSSLHAWARVFKLPYTSELLTRKGHLYNPGNPGKDGLLCWFRRQRNLHCGAILLIPADPFSVEEKNGSSYIDSHALHRADRTAEQVVYAGITGQVMIDSDKRGGIPMNQNLKNRNSDAKYEYMVPAVDRAARIMMLFQSQTRGMTISEVTEATGWHKSSVHKLLVTLSHHGLLDRNESTKQYSLGIALVRYGQLVLNNLDIAHRAKSFLRELSEYSGETANYSLLRNSEMIIVDSIESRAELRMVPSIGMVNSLTTKSSGKAVLAFFPEAQANKIIQDEGLPAFTKNSITDPQKFSKELAAIRKRGFAVDIEEFREGVSAISAPVFNPTGDVMGALSLIGPAFRLTKDKVPQYGKKCSETAAQLSAMMLH